MGYYIGEVYWGKGLGSAAVKRYAAMFLAAAILSAFLQNHLPTTLLLAGYLKRVDLNARAHCAVTPLKMAAFWI